MGKVLTKEEIKAKKKYHDKRYKYYCDKLTDLKKKESRIGFKY